MSEFGTLKGDVCGRSGCIGVIDEHPKEGSCTCHLNPPCSYCTTPNQYCPECGWEAEDDMIEYISLRPKYKVPEFIYKSPQERYNELPDGVFRYVYTQIEKTFVEVKGKHPNMSRNEICQRLGCADKESMAKFKHYDENTFVVSYFID